jgi:hypothetical protein
MHLPFWFDLHHPRESVKQRSKFLFLGKIPVERSGAFLERSGIPACEAGASIKPGVERGFASETPGQDGKRISAYIIRTGLGFRSQSLAPPQALCLHLLRSLQEPVR